MILSSRVRSLGCIVSSLALYVAPLSAQTGPSIALVGGVSQYDLSGTGTAPFIAARADVVPGRARFMVFEAGLEFFAYDPQFGERRIHWFPEAMIQLQWPSAYFRPYLGAGAGYSFSSARDALTLSAAAGLRISLASTWALRGELRLRSVDPWTGVTADWGAGLSRSF